MDMNIENIAKSAKKASIKTMTLKDEVKNRALEAIKQKIIEKRAEILDANKKDLEESYPLVEAGKMSGALYKRLELGDRKIDDLIKGLEDLVKLKDPVNQTVWQRELDDGLILKKVTVPIGTIGVIYEARPDCFIQIASLIIKSGNTGILKGGAEAHNTNTCFAKIVEEALSQCPEFPENTINLIYSREDIRRMFVLDKYIDLIIPRGSNSLVKYIKDNTRIPVLGHAAGICHIYADVDAVFEDIVRITFDAKCQYPSACNAIETLLINQERSDIEEIKNALREKGIRIVENPESYDIEYSDTILAVKTVENTDDAIEHINTYSSNHTDCIISNNQENIEKFMNFVDSSSVFANCSTRFADGFRYGFGAEVGISTNKTHARGPVGLEGLTIYKYKLYGTGNIVDDYAKGTKTFKHKDL